MHDDNGMDKAYKENKYLAENAKLGGSMVVGTCLPTVLSDMKINCF